ncbi:BAG family molecular chaperone regulator 4-like isoform X2 [Magnolia sinica]|uniref:BAG family molecular chaperone regulator 4-like isoform X2 n=1 Tax=Magnolia sinica TaxID=86752 RepID=UPI00265855E6|nr:BAG family molecular chaperone regulator 4-like isoform X2 [Magnolia sinica]
MEETPNRGVGVSENGIEEIDSELRPIEMLSQKTNGKTNGDDGVWASGPMIKINASHSTKQHQMTLPVHSTFGVKDMSKVVLMEDAASKERKLEEMKRDQVISEALNSVALVRAEVDKLSQKASSLEAVMHGGTKVAEKEFVVLTELFMAQLLKLDSIDAGGEAKVQRQSEVRCVQNCVEALDKLKVRNSNPFISSSNAVSTLTEWATFDSGVGSRNAFPTLSSSCKITHDWERFD